MEVAVFTKRLLEAHKLNYVGTWCFIFLRHTKKASLVDWWQAGSLPTITPLTGLTSLTRIFSLLHRSKNHRPRLSGQGRVEVFTLGPQVFYTAEHGPSNYTSPSSVLPSIFPPLPPPPPPLPPQGLLALLLWNLTVSSIAFLSLAVWL